MIFLALLKIIYLISEAEDVKPPNDPDEDAAARMRLKRKLQRNRTSFSQEQIEALERGKDFLFKSSSIVEYFITSCQLLMIFASSCGNSIAIICNDHILNARAIWHSVL